jgi:hypothetical protein
VTIIASRRFAKGKAQVMERKKLYALLTALPLLAALSACHNHAEMSEEWWCNYYGTCKKEASAMCSFYGNCPDAAKSGGFYGASSTPGSGGWGSSVWGSGRSSGSGATASGFSDPGTSQ